MMDEKDKIMYDIFKSMVEDALKPVNDRLEELKEQVDTIQRSLSIVNMINLLIENKKISLIIISGLLTLSGFLGMHNYRNAADLEQLKRQIAANHQEVMQFTHTIKK